jgi:NAD(P)-dependent dehydrogenase (short-subunit alcohol dehydrogenase family)
MSGRFAGKVAVVTGASRGIGLGIAQRLAAEGARVAVSARTAEAHPKLPGSLAETMRLLHQMGPGPHVAIVADLTDEKDRLRIVPEARAALGPVDILVNNAAAAIYQPSVDYPLKRRRLTLEVNFHAPLDLAQQVIPEMRARGAGWIVNLSSGSARFQPGPPFPDSPVAPTIGVYGASKAALNRITWQLALELFGSGIRVNAIEPRAAVLSPGADELVGDHLTADQIEPLEAMVEATLALCDCDPDTTGRIAVSLDLLAERGIPVMTLDGKRRHEGA